MFKKTKNLILDYLYKPKNFYSAERLKYIYDILCRNRIVNNENHDLLIDLFREIPEILIWGDQNDPKVHEFFFGKNMIMFFIMIIKQNCGSQLTYQILQAFNIIFDNISNKESLNAFLSNNNMNYIISYGYNENLVEIIAYYISLIKILSMKVEESSLDLFYDHQFDFPVFSRTILLFNHKERMIRIHVRNIILNLLKARNKSVDTYFIQFLAEVYFLHLFANIRTLIIELNDFTKSSDAHCNTIKFNSEELFDIFQFLNDMLEISSDQISIATQYFLIDFLFYKFLIPALYTADNNSLPSQIKIEKYIFIFILSQLISVIYHLPTQFNLLKIVFLTPTPKIGSEIIPTYAELDPISTMLHERGIVKNDYNIEHRIQAFLSKLCIHFNIFCSYGNKKSRQCSV
uniref:Protein CLEC16A (Trinotate prediction) n=1 Tax=Henneguya salminicola TaxID=69463 RepID=A0A6G3MDI1_HENSL